MDDLGVPPFQETIMGMWMGKYHKQLKVYGNIMGLLVIVNQLSID